MKRNLRFLMSLVVMLLATATTWAAEDWETVKLKTMALSSLTSTDTIYIKNVGTGRYLAGGEAWNHQIVVSPISNAAKCVLKKLDDGTYNIHNGIDGWGDGNTGKFVWRCTNDSKIGQGRKGCFCDGVDKGDLAKWTINAVEGKTNVYTFQVPSSITDEYVEGQYWGVNRTHETGNKVNGITWGLYYDCVLGDSAANCQFVFISAKLCDAKMRLYNLKGSLPAGTDVSEADAVLSNENATTEQVEAEIEKLIGKTRKAGTTTHPTDVTKAYLANTTPTAANSVPAGWTVTNANGDVSTTGTNNGGLCEFWNTDNRTLKTTIRLPKGVYRFSCEATTKHNGTFFVNNDAIALTKVTTPYASEVKNMFERGEGISYISVKLPADADVTIGVTAGTGEVWTTWRNFYIESLGEELPATALSVPAQDASAHYATFSSAAPTVFAATGATVYGVSVNNGAIQLNELAKATYKLADREKNEVEGYYVPANTGVLVKTASADAAEAQHHFPMEVLSVEFPANQLKSANADGSVFTAQDGYRYYKLAYNNFTEKTGLGFYWGADNGAAFALKAGLAYLAVPATEAGAKGFRFDGVTDGIDGVSVDGSKAQVIYNVNGQRVANMSKVGLYIVDGKKVVVK